MTYSENCESSGRSGMESETAAAKQQHQQHRLPPGTAIANRGSDNGGGGGDGTTGSDDGSSSKLWDRMAADDRRIGSEECLKLWMEMEARCSDGRGLVESLKNVVDEMVPSSDPQPPALDHQREEDEVRDVSDGRITTRLRGGGSGGSRGSGGSGGGSGGGLEEVSIDGDRQEGSMVREKDEWSQSEAAALLEAYELRFGDGRTGNLKAREWEDVAAAVNRHFDGTGGVGQAKKTLPQCKRKVYALRRWYKTVVAKQMNFRHDAHELSLLRVLERLMTPSSSSPAGIPGGIDAGERLSEPLTPSVFDGEDDEEELKKGSKAVLQSSSLGAGLLGLLSNANSGRKRDGFSEKKRRRVGPTTSQGMSDNNCGVENLNNLRNKRGCSSSCGASTHSDEVVDALNGFAKVLAQVEQTKMDIMKDLERHRAELQLKLASVESFGEQDFSDLCPPSSMLSLL